MKNTSKQLRSLSAACEAWQTTADYRDDGDVRLCAIPVHMAFDRIDVLATFDGGPMT